QLARELATVKTDAERELVRDQLVAKLQRKKRHVSGTQGQDFETVAGMTPDAFIRELKAKSLPDIAAWFTENPELGEILDRASGARRPPTLISTHDDALAGVHRGYGSAEKPEDYINEFSAFIKAKGNEIPALVAVLTRPRELTRKQLRELALELDRAGFSET